METILKKLSSNVLYPPRPTWWRQYPILPSREIFTGLSLVGSKACGVGKKCVKAIINL